MSDQELTTVEETAEVDVRELSESTPSESHSASVEVGDMTESSPSSAEPSVAQAEEDIEVPLSPESDSSPETTEEIDPESFSIHTLKIGQHLTGKVKSITEFGAFVDIGIPQDGLVHISKLAKRKVDKVTEVVSVGQEVDVWVKKIDKKRGRISLTMIKPITLKLKDIKEEAELEGVITRLEQYGAFVDIGSDRDGLVHISQVTHEYINHPEEALAVGDKVDVKVLKVDRKKRQVDLSIKELLPLPPPPEEEVIQELPETREKQGETKSVAAEEKVAEEESLPTAMAIAYAAFQQDEKQTGRQAKDKNRDSRDENKKKENIDAIIARTLATRE